MPKATKLNAGREGCLLGGEIIKKESQRGREAVGFFKKELWRESVQKGLNKKYKMRNERRNERDTLEKIIRQKRKVVWERKKTPREQE